MAGAEADAHIAVGNEKEKGGTETTFRLFDLPPELRLRIFEFAVTSKLPIQITTSNDPQDDMGNIIPAVIAEWMKPAAIAQRTQPALTRTCTEIRADALKLYYTCNKFEAGYCEVAGFEERATLVRWLKCIGAVSRGLLRSLKISDVHSAEIGDEQDACMHDECDGVSTGARLDLLRLGAVIEAVDGELAVHMVTFPGAKTEQ